LSNTNESATTFILLKKIELNRAKMQGAAYLVKKDTELVLHFGQSYQQDLDPLLYLQKRISAENFNRGRKQQ